MLLLFALFALTFALAYYHYARRLHDATWQSFRDRYRRDDQRPDSDRPLDPDFQFEEEPGRD